MHSGPGGVEAGGAGGRGSPAAWASGSGAEEEEEGSRETHRAVATCSVLALTFANTEVPRRVPRGAVVVVPIEAEKCPLQLRAPPPAAGDPATAHSSRGCKLAQHGAMSPPRVLQLKRQHP